jgi:hypothetical protein
VRFRWRRRSTSAALHECRLRGSHVAIASGDTHRGDVAASDKGTIIGGPVRDAVLGLVRGMDSRIHPFSVVAAHRTSSDPNLDFSGREIHAPTPGRAKRVRTPQAALTFDRR